MGDDQLKVSISGREIYKAVANYIKDNPALQKTIEDKVKEVMESTMWENAIRGRIDREFGSWDIRDFMKKEISKELKKHVETFLTKDKLKKVIQDSFKVILDA